MNAEFNDIVNSVVFSDYDTDKTKMTITVGPDSGVEFVFGKIWFPDENEPILSFDYDIVSEQKPVDLDAFRNIMGAVLQAAILKAVGEGSAVYAGGVDVAEGKIEPPEPTIFDKPPVESKILTPWNYKLPEPEPGTKMSRNLLEGPF